MWDKVSKALKQILDDNALIGNVYNYEASELTGTPVATLTPSANENEYDSTTENLRTYAFLIRLYMIRGSGATKEHRAESAMRELVDSVLDDLDKSHRLSDLESKTGYCFILLTASPSIWGYSQREDTHRVAEIEVRAVFSVDVTAIS